MVARYARAMVEATGRQEVLVREKPQEDFSTKEDHFITRPASKGKDIKTCNVTRRLGREYHSITSPCQKVTLRLYMLLHRAGEPQLLSPNLLFWVDGARVTLVANDDNTKNTLCALLI